ncbi:hypothetical protein NMG60_11029547 [Bertholletia excelsa]
MAHHAKTQSLETQGKVGEKTNKKGQHPLDDHKDPADVCCPCLPCCKPRISVKAAKGEAEDRSFIKS